MLSLINEYEKEARELFRDILLHQYVDGHPCGKEADDWLRKHGGWFPDDREAYGDGASVPNDDGLDICSPHPDALQEAFHLIANIEKWLAQNPEALSDDLNRHISGQLKKLRSKKPQLAPV